MLFSVRVGGLGMRRAATAVTPANVIRARQLIKENPRVTYLELQHSLDISSESVFLILHERLQVQKR